MKIKKTFVLGMVACLLMGCGEQDNEKEWIKTCEKVYSVIDGEEVLFSETKYNTVGNVEKKSEYYESSEDYEEYIYNDGGDLEKEIYTYVCNGEESEDVYVVEKSLSPEGKEIFVSNGEQFRNEYMFDSEGVLESKCLISYTQNNYNYWGEEVTTIEEGEKYGYSNGKNTYGLHYIVAEDGVRRSGFEYTLQYDDNGALLGGEFRSGSEIYPVEYSVEYDWYDDQTVKCIIVEREQSIDNLPGTMWCDLNCNRIIYYYDTDGNCVREEQYIQEYGVEYIIEYEYVEK